VGKEDPALLNDVAEGKTKLGAAVKKTAALKAMPKAATAKKDPSKIEARRRLIPNDLLNLQMAGNSSLLPFVLE
jgi:hypothetical protein